jgi:hypothetical protein
MNRATAVLFLIAAIGLALTLGGASVAQAAPMVALVGGGGVATFDDGRVPNQTQFGLGASLYADGTAKGRFECIITGYVSVSAQIISGVLNGDGSVTFDIISDVRFPHSSPWFPGGPILGVPMTLTVSAGGPGVGTFVLNADHETVQDGNIHVQTQ